MSANKMLQWWINALLCILFVIIFIVLMIFFSGCVSTQPQIIRTEYVRVEVPVVYPIEKPDEPECNNEMPEPECLNIILTYARRLKLIINEYGNP